MAFSKADKEYLDLLFDSKLEPLKSKNEIQDTTIEGVRITVEGKDGKNGIKSKVEYLNRFAWLITGGLVVLSSALFGKVFHIF